MSNVYVLSFIENFSGEQTYVKAYHTEERAYKELAAKSAHDDACRSIFRTWKDMRNEAMNSLTFSPETPIAQRIAAQNLCLNEFDTANPKPVGNWERSYIVDVVELDGEVPA